jgi:hypothetical protein
MARVAGPHSQWQPPLESLRPGMFPSSSPASDQFGSGVTREAPIFLRAVTSKGSETALSYQHGLWLWMPVHMLYSILCLRWLYLNVYRSRRLVLFAMTSRPRLKVIATRTSRVCLRRCGSLRVTSSRSGKATMQFFKCIMHAVAA